MSGIAETTHFRKKIKENELKDGRIFRWREKGIKCEDGRRIRTQHTELQVEKCFRKVIAGLEKTVVREWGRE